MINNKEWAVRLPHKNLGHPTFNPLTHSVLIVLHSQSSKASMGFIFIDSKDFLTNQTEILQKKTLMYPNPLLKEVIPEQLAYTTNMP